MSNSPVRSRQTPSSIHHTAYAREAQAKAQALSDSTRAQRVQALAERYDDEKFAYDRAFQAQNVAFEHNLLRNVQETHNSVRMP